MPLDLANLQVLAGPIVRRVDFQRATVWVAAAACRSPRPRHADLYNKYYNPGGKLQASTYRFPFDDEAFDFVFLVSVFTHMLPTDMEHYLSEIAEPEHGVIYLEEFVLGHTGRMGWSSNSCLTARGSRGRILIQTTDKISS